LSKYLKPTAGLCLFVTTCLVTLSQLLVPSVAFAAQSGPLDSHRCAIAFASDLDRVPGLPAVTNYTGASDITATTALLTGKVISRGCPPHNVVTTPATVHIFWGTVDGGHTAAKWQHDVNLGIQPGSVFAAYVAGLTPCTTYYYRSFLRNSAGAVWAGSSQSLTTRDIVN
jgi:hypothetical protein